MVELEKKLLLSKEEYNYLIEHFRYDNQKFRKPITEQINYYFDTNDFLMNKQNTTCRVRLKDGKYQAIMKQHSRGSDHSVETKMEIYNGISSNSFTDVGLKLQGELKTARCIVFKDKTCEVTLDKNEYLGYIDYELEIEYAPSFEHYAKRILSTIISCLTNNISRQPLKELYNRMQEVPSKSTRFFERFSLKGRRNV